MWQLMKPMSDWNCLIFGIFCSKNCDYDCFWESMNRSSPRYLQLEMWCQCRPKAKCRGAFSMAQDSTSFANFKRRCWSYSKFCFKMTTNLRTGHTTRPPEGRWYFGPHREVAFQTQTGNPHQTRRMQQNGQNLLADFYASIILSK